MHFVAFLLLIIGGLNWLLQGIFKWDISVVLPGGMMGWTARVIYILVGLAAVYEIFAHRKTCKACEPKKDTGGSMESKPMESKPMEPNQGEGGGQ